MLNNFKVQGKASFLLGGQWGSEGKGASAAVVADQLDKRGEAFNIYTTNAGSQSGHTSLHNGQKRVAFHLPTAALINHKAGLVYLNAGAIIDVDILEQELKDVRGWGHIFSIHPNAAIITQDCKDAEGAADSAQTKIASTRKGVGQALARKVLRSGMVAKDHPFTKHYARQHDLNHNMTCGLSVLVEIPQGIGLSLNGPFYPHATSRDCTVTQAMNDAGIHPQFYGKSMLVLRTYPIRVGNINATVGVDMSKDAGGGSRTFETQLGFSGACYPDQQETSWEQIGVPAEITTVTKRVRRVFTFSLQQAEYAMRLTRPDVVHLTFCDYPGADVIELTKRLMEIAHHIGLNRQPEFVFQYGPSTADAYGEPL